MKQMRIDSLIHDNMIGSKSQCTFYKDPFTNKYHIVGINLVCKGILTDWLKEYIDNPVNSKLHKIFIMEIEKWLKSLKEKEKEEESIA